MGIKALRAQYRVLDNVVLHRYHGRLCVGLRDIFASEVFSFLPDGADYTPWSRHFAKAGLSDLYDSVSRDRARFAQLLAQEDTFDKSIPVYRAVDGVVETHHCEVYGDYEVTHGGLLMRVSVFHLSPAKAVADAKDSVVKDVERLKLALAQAQKLAQRAKEQFDAALVRKSDLERLYPEGEEPRGV